MAKTFERYIAVRGRLGRVEEWDAEDLAQALTWARLKSFMPTYAMVVQTMHGWKRRCKMCGHTNMPLLKEETLPLRDFLARYAAKPTPAAAEVQD